MQQRPSWEANWILASQEIPHILWNLDVHHHIYNSPPPAPILSQIKQDNAPSPISRRSILHFADQMVF
jgi:hypothetical protein